MNDTGADVKTIQSILGQLDYKTTMDRYVHPREDRKQTAIQNVSALLNENNYSKSTNIHPHDQQ